jgi:paraquat-inducible protein B
VEIVTYPERLIARLSSKEAVTGKSIARTEQGRHAFFQRLVDERGLRAQLRSGNLLTGQLYVAFDYFPDAPKVKIDWSREPTIVPVVPSTVQDLEAKLNSVVAKLEKLPYDEIGADLAKALAGLNQTLQDASKALNGISTDLTPALKATIEEIRGAVASAEGLLKSTDATLIGRDAPAQQELRDALQEIARAARSVRVLVEYLDRHPEALLRGKTDEAK